MRRESVDVLWVKQKKYCVLRVKKATFKQAWANSLYKYQVSVYKKKEVSNGVWSETKKMIWSSSWKRGGDFNEALHTGIAKANEYNARQTAIKQQNK